MKLSLLAACAFTFAACAAAEKSAADATYLGQQVQCIDDNATKAAIDACRAAVKAAWSSGGDAGKDSSRE